jgi:Bardet-Biedl syndrome 2 protein
MILGKLPTIETPLAVVGGNCSIQGFDYQGNELFWTVTGDNVSSLAFCDANDDGENQLLVGSEDFEIRIFQQETAINEVTETDRVVALTPIRSTLYGYALGNGTIGVYNRASRVWRVKSKNSAMCLEAFDLDADGVPELVSGWSNGKIEVRSDQNGEVIYRDHFSSPVSSIVSADYRMDGREEIICCALDGEVRAYLPADAEMQQASNGSGIGQMQEDHALAELTQEKQELLLELRGLEDNLRHIKNGDTYSGAGAIPPNTSVSLEIAINQPKQCCELILSTNNETVIKGVILFTLDGSLFDQESLMIYPANPTTTARVPILAKKNAAVDLQISVLVGARGNAVQFHVIELQHSLPKFAMFMPVKNDGATRGARVSPDSHVSFNVQERVSRVMQWVQQSFHVSDLGAGDREGLHLNFVSLRDGQPIGLSFTPDNGGTMTIGTESMELAAEVVQDLCLFLQVQELESAAVFPAEMSVFRDVLMRVDDYNATRLKLTAEMADSSNQVKTLVIKAEDARILGDMALMKRMYAELFTLNNQLIGEYVKRATNHQALLGALKEVNHMIQKAARLRVGSAKTRVVTACRNAIKTDNIQSLFNIIKEGHRD